MHSTRSFGGRLGHALAFTALAAVCTPRSAAADTYCDLLIERVQATPTGVPGDYLIEVDVLMQPDGLALALTQPIVVRAYVNGQPQGEDGLGTFAALSGACCSSGLDCDQVSGWAVTCVGTCGSGSGGPYACAYRRKTTFSVSGVAPGSIVSAIVDPDGLHVETCSPGTSNNFASVVAPVDAVHDLSVVGVALSPSPVPGAWLATTTIAVTPGAFAPQAPVLVRLAGPSGTIGEFSVNSHGISSGQCCSSDAQCAPCDGWSVSCEGECAGVGSGGAYTCVYRTSSSSDLGPLTAGSVVTAVIDPDGWFLESGDPGHVDNTASALVPGQPPTAYCTGKTNSAGCAPEVSFSGAPSASAPSAFVVGATAVLPGRNGVLFYGHQPASLPFLGGTLCVHTPVRRTGLQTASGNPSQLDCSGAFAFDFNARIQSGIDPTLIAGAQVNAQYWYRDSGDPTGSGLSNALEFTIGN